MAIKTERNKRVQSRYDALMREGKHGHYETMFRVVREEVEPLRAAMESIRDAKEPPTNPAPDDRDWRDMALEMKRVATVSLSQASD